MGRESHCQNFLDLAFQVRKQNMVKAHKKHEAIDGLFAEIQPTVGELHCQKVLGGTFRFGTKD